MPYATPQDMASRFGADEVLALADRDLDGVADAGVLEGALADADAEIDAYLAGRYRLPLATVPLVLQRTACDIARYHLTGGAATETEAVRNRYKDAVRFLDQVSKGGVLLGVDTAGAEVPSAPDPVQFTSGGRVFDRGSR